MAATVKQEIFFLTPAFEKMKTLDNHTLIYDNECPMCDLYTSGFIKTGMMDKDGRVCYADARPLTPSLDMQRARNEIALVNRNTGHVTYGIDSLFTILGNRFPVLRFLFSCTPFRWFISKFYKFISYNRKVIAPSRTFESPGSCVPDFNLKYRLAYILLTWLLTSWIVTQYVALLVPIVTPSTMMREYWLSGGLILSQLLVVLRIRKDRAIHYVGNMMTVSMMGAIVLWIVMKGFYLVDGVSPIIAVIVLLTVVFLMLIEHMRRVRMLGLPLAITVTWVVYRFIALFIIL